jgi:6-phosphofructokinase
MVNKGNAVIGQSGGPTAVINQSLVGVIEGLRSGLQAVGAVNTIYGMRNGVRGLTRDELVDLGALHQDRLDLLAITPSAALGSTRDKPDAAYCERVLEACRTPRHPLLLLHRRQRLLRHLPHRQRDGRRKAGYEMRCFHVPKTVDNDLIKNDHTPGFPSAARFVAMACMADFLDNISLPGIKINVIMGRHAGFLTAASALARRSRPRRRARPTVPSSSTSPRSPFDLDRFIADVEAIYAKKGRCHIAVSEGIQDASGTVPSAPNSSRAPRSTPTATCSSPAPAPSATSSPTSSRETHPRRRQAPPRPRRHLRLHPALLARRLPVDRIEARRAGRQAAVFALQGHPSGSVAIVRTGKGHDGETYASAFERVELRDIAAKTRHIPPEFLDGTHDVSQAFLDYCRPLVGDLPNFERL